jgi:hypothetical protein
MMRDSIKHLQMCFFNLIFSRKTGTDEVLAGYEIIGECGEEG